MPGNSTSITPTSLHGEYTSEVLANNLGLSAAQFETMKAQGAISGD